MSSFSSSPTSLKTRGIVSEDDLFAMGMSARWLRRLLENSLLPDSEAVDLLDWMDDSSRERLYDIVLLWVETEGRAFGEHRKYVEELAAGLRLGLGNTYKDNCFDRLVQLGGSRLASRLKDEALDITASLLLLIREDMHLEKAAANFRHVFGLSEVEGELARFFYIMATWQKPASYFLHHLGCDKCTNMVTLAMVLDVPTPEMRRLIRGKLHKLDIIRAGYANNWLLNDAYAALFEEPDEIAGPLSSAMADAPIPLEEFPVAPSEVACAAALLRHVGDAPAHLLLHGAPGTGKTSFAHALIRSLSLQAYEMPAPTHPVDDQRAAAMEACLIRADLGKNGIFIMDDADAILNIRPPFKGACDRSDAKWLDSLLERPGLRMIWIINDLDGVEESALRRFSFNIAFGPLGPGRRLALLERILSRHKAAALLPAPSAQQIAKRYPVAAGSYDLSVRHAAAIAPDDPETFRATLEQLLSSADALLHKRHGAWEDEEQYTFDGLNLSRPVPDLLQDLKAYDHFLDTGGGGLNINCNILLYGHPGTGKTTFAKCLARHLEREIMILYGNDLLSDIVGGTEKNIATAFREAERGGKILLINEIDSLLSRRSKATQGFEVRQVNEFMTRMEEFRGILVCTTNRTNCLEPASIWRFTHQIKTDYLNGDGVLTFFDKMLAPLCGNPLSEIDRNRLKDIRKATPGDFKTIRDRCILQPKAANSPSALVDMLEEGTRLKAALGNLEEPAGIKARSPLYQ